MESLEKDIQSSNTLPEVVNPNEEKKGSIWLIFLNIFLAIVTLCLVAYIAQKKGYIDIYKIFDKQEVEEVKEENNDDTEVEEEENDDTEVEEEENEDTDVVVEEEETMETFNGEYISAIVPDGWSIVEYADGEGSDMLVDGVEYTGLTAIKILKGTTEVMSIGAVSSIGFVGCQELPRFDDSSSEYENEQSEINEVVGDNLEIIDYTNTEYSDIDFLEKDFRRVNTSLYYDTVEGNDYFEPQCEKQFMSLNDISFFDSYDYEGTAYTYEISSTSTEDDLDVLDDILESIVTVN